MSKKILKVKPAIFPLISGINEIVEKIDKMIDDSDCCVEIKSAMVIHLTELLAECLADITEGVEHTITMTDGLPFEKVIEIKRKEVA